MNSVFSKKIWIPVAAILVFFAAGPSGAADKKPGEGNAALVNGKPITRAELDRETAVVLRNLANRGQTPDDEKMGEITKNVLEGLIGSELLAQEAKKKGIKVDQAVVTSRFDAIKARFPNEEEFKSALAKGDHTESSIKAVIEKGLLIQEFINKEFVEKTIVTPEESKA
ncbi:MAG: SurA N-terminal domain-containing protein, partial [Deltaproteobacteria bacterium]|nr:SurA N-terminal domain-containing protein [Deltaproteobacteria bacterium]